MIDEALKIRSIQSEQSADKNYYNLTNRESLSLDSALFSSLHKISESNTSGNRLTYKISDEYNDFSKVYLLENDKSSEEIQKLLSKSMH